MNGKSKIHLRNQKMTKEALKVVRLSFREKSCYTVFLMSMISYGIYITIIESRSNITYKGLVLNIIINLRAFLIEDFIDYKQQRPSWINSDILRVKTSFCF